MELDLSLTVLSQLTFKTVKCHVNITLLRSMTVGKANSTEVFSQTKRQQSLQDGVTSFGS